MIPGKVIRLRPIERADLPRFVEWFADPEVREGITLFMPLSLAQEEQWFEDGLKRDRAEQTLAIEAPTANGWTMIGTTGFHEIDWRNRRGEFGIAIGAKEFWNRGFGTDAVRTLVGFGFGELNLERIMLRVYDDNLRAIRCYEKAGFTLEGRLRRDRYHNGRYSDTLLMGVLRSEWETHPA